MQPDTDANGRSRLGRLWAAETGGGPGARLRGTLAVLVAVAAFVVACDQFHVPDARDASAPADAFSAGRAMTHIERIAVAPRPQGSEAAAAAREYVIAQFAALGLEAQTQTTTAVRTTEGTESVFAATVVNVMARIPGTDSTGAIVVSGHYDSGPNARGAGDCGSCVATVIEVARALLAGPPLRNDVILLVPDGEETQLFGARAFMQEHPWGADVRFALNLESQGVEGPAVFYVSSPEDETVAARVIEYARQPVAWSFLSTLVRGLVGGSDLDAFTDEEVAGAGVAYFEAPQYYHTRLDSPDRLNEASVQHMGDYALGVARGLGGDDLGDLDAGRDAVYFTLWRGAVVRYPGALALPLALLATVALGAALVVGRRRGRLGAARSAAAGTLLAGGAILVVLVTTLVWVLVRITNADYHVMLVGVTYDAGRFVVGFALLAGALLLAGYIWAVRRWRRLDVLAGALLLWWLLALLTAAVLPAFSALFLWPLLAGIAVLAFEVLRPHLAERPWVRLGSFALVAVTTTLLILPAVVLFQTLGGRVEAIAGFPAMGLPILWVALGLGVVLPVLPLPEVRRAWLFPAALGVASLLAIAGTSLAAGFDDDHPRPNMMMYRLDADAGSAAWETAADPAFGRGRGGQRDAWTSQFLTDAVEAEVAPWSAGPEMTLAGYRAPAPAVALPPPTVEVLGQRSDGAGRTLTLRLASPRGAPNVRMHIDGEVMALRVDGVAAELDGVGFEDGGWFYYLSLPAGGVELELRTGAAGPLRIEVEDWSQGLPDVPGMTIRPRPDDMMTSAHDLADTTMVRKTYVLE